jgi:hypothetical protein
MFLEVPQPVKAPVPARELDKPAESMQRIVASYRL